MAGAVSLLPVREAISRIVAGVTPVETERVDLAAAYGKTLAEPIAAPRDQPPFPSSAMDGYAVRAADSADGAALKVIGTSAAGKLFGGTVGRLQAVRIFTGAPVPDGADAVLIQENAETGGDDEVTATAPVAPGANIRRAGLDFEAGRTLLEPGVRIGAGEIGLAAAAGRADLLVRRRPIVAVLATGDELVTPGSEPGPDQIYASGGVAIRAYLASIGADSSYLGVAPDDPRAIGERVDRARAMAADILVTIGGVSVGEHDLVQPALSERGMKLDFWKVAVRPGKPLMFGMIGAMRVIGLPGNPVSALVCSVVFVRPLVEALLGRPPDDGERPARLGADVPANGPRASYLRATLADAGGGAPTANPLPIQDSSMQLELATADCLLVREANAPAAAAGEPCRIIPLR